MESEEHRTEPPVDGQARGASASRRSLLARGLVAGPVALASMRPVKTLANSYYCTMSGWHSFSKNGKTSAHPKNKCKSGKSKSRFSGGSSWPSKCPNYKGNYVTLKSSTKFDALFPNNLQYPNSSSDQTTLLTYLGKSCDQGTFITAIFNAENMGSNYPFTPSQIYTIWTTPSYLGSGVTFAQAVTFFNQLDIS